MAAAKPFIQRLVPRISLRNLLLFMTCVALAIALWRTKQQIGPMRTQIAALRTELGYLTIDEPELINAIQRSTHEVLNWQWRIHLPTDRTFRVFCYSGFLPPRDGKIADDWLAAVNLQGDGPRSAELSTPTALWLSRIKRLGEGGQVAVGRLQGEFTFDAKIVKLGEQWVMQINSGNPTPILQPNGNWLSDERSRGSVGGDLQSREQLKFNPDKPVVLLHMRRPVVKEFPGGGSSHTEPVGDADSIVMWIEPVPTVESDTSKDP